MLKHLALLLLLGSAFVIISFAGQCDAAAAPAQDNVTVAPLVGQWPDYPVDKDDRFQPDRGPGAYFAWYKLAAIAGCFLLWMWLSEFMNVDATEMHTQTGIAPQVINPINLFSYLFGFLAIITIPIFWIGLPVYLLTTFLPFVIYVVMRNKRVDPEDKAFSSMHWITLYRNGNLYQAKEVELAAFQGPEMDFAAGGETGEAQQYNLIAARQAEQFPAVKVLLHDALKKRASSIVMDFTQQTVNTSMEVDGFWHQLPVLDRPTGDSMLVALKWLGGLNAKERRLPQKGNFTAIIDLAKTGVEIISQGVKTGERVELKISQNYASKLTLPQLGMWPEMVEATTNAINHPGISIISAPPKNGLSTSWNSVMNASDRMMRDMVAFVDKDEAETHFENVARETFVSGGQGNVAELKSLLLRNPDAFVLPEQVNNGEFYDVLIDEIISNDRALITKVSANTAAEALLRVMKQVGDRKKFVQVVKLASAQRLVRRLCDQCKQPVKLNPAFLQQLGVKPGQEVNVFGPYQLPPVEQRVDEHGKPVEMQECQVCSGLGYVGRIAVFETLVVDDEIRKVLLSAPKLENVAKVAIARGNKTLMQQGYRLALSGVTSVQEIQRVFQSKKK